MNRLTLILSLIVVILFVTSGFLLDGYINLKEEKQTLSASINTSRDSLTHYKTKSGLMAAQVEQQAYTMEQLKNMKLPELDEIKSAIKELKLNQKDARSYVGTNTVTNNHIYTKGKDSTIYDTVHVEAINYDSKWFHIHGYREEGDSTWDLKIQSEDSLQFVGAIKRSWFLGKAHVTGTAVSKNPNTKIVGIDFIDIKSSHKFLWWTWY